MNIHTCSLHYPNPLILHFPSSQNKHFAWPRPIFRIKYVALCTCACHLLFVGLEGQNK